MNTYQTLSHVWVTDNRGDWRPILDGMPVEYGSSHQGGNVQMSLVKKDDKAFILVYEPLERVEYVYRLEALIDKDMTLLLPSTLSGDELKEIVDFLMPRYEHLKIDSYVSGE